MKNPDVFEKSLTQPDTYFFVGAQKRDLKDIRELILIGHYDLTLLMKPMDRPKGYGKVTVRDVSGSEASGKNWTKVKTNSLAVRNDFSSGFDVSEGENWKRDTRTGRRSALTQNEDEGGGISENPDGQLTYSKQDRRGKSRSESVEEGESSGVGGSLTFSNKSGKTDGTTRATSEGDAAGGSLVKTSGWADKTTFLPEYREEWYPAGLENPTEVQDLDVMGVLRTQQQRDVTISHAHHAPVKARVHFVADAWEGRPLRRAYEMKKLQEKLEAWHGFYFEPVGVEKWRSQRIESSNGRITRKLWE